MRNSFVVAAVAAALVLTSGVAEAAVKTRVVTYRQGDTVLQGLVAWDDAVKGKRPGVLVIHEWWGHNEHARNQAKRLARAGFVGFALDMYGRGKVARHPKDAQAMMQAATSDPQVVRARFDAALEQLRRDPRVDAERIAVVGYCMGGTIALNVAASGAEVDAVSTFHAGLQGVPTSPQQGTVKARVLINSGAADPMVPAAQLQAVEQGWEKAGARVDVVQYEGARHSFTNPDADKAGIPALGYDARADQESWQNTMKFFSEVFGNPAKQ